MAELKVKGEYVGPGEQKTAEYLAEHLPDNWVIFANRKLAGQNRDDVDLIVVGDRLIFVLEEKSWGPRILMGDGRWTVNGQSRTNPLDRIGQLSRKIAGLFVARVQGYREHVRHKAVVPAVILSHPNVEYFADRNHDPSEIVWRLEEAPRTLRSQDSSAGDSLGGRRAAILAYLDDLPAQQPGHGFQLGDYEIVERLEVPGVELAYSAKSSDGQDVLLKCYPMSAFADFGDPREFLTRETHAINRLAEVNRTWRALPYFEESIQQLMVVPVVPAGRARNLATSMTAPGPERVDGDLDPAVAKNVVLDAFAALAEVHEFGLVHRALHPRRIWLGRGMRVMFSDFHLARISGMQTIALWTPDGDISEDYRAPECAANVGLATANSDVYSLALSLCAWLLNEDVTELQLSTVRERMLERFAWSEPLLTGLHSDQAVRPNAQTIAEQLTAPVAALPNETDAPESEVFKPDAVIAGRYEIVRELGSGGFATSWLVYDRQALQTKVLKEFRNGVNDQLRDEYLAADQLHHDCCGRVYDVQLNQEPQYLVSEYVEGESLDVLGIQRSLPEIRNIARCMLEALDYIHGKDLVHGDVTPANAIVASDGTGHTKLIDYGLAVRVGTTPGGWHPRFAAPEVVTGEPARASSDIFGAATTLAYAMLGRTVTRLNNGAIEIIEPTDIELAGWGPDGSAILQAIMSGVQIKPADRPDSAAEFWRRIASAEVPPTIPDDDERVAMINPSVAEIRRLYRASSSGNGGNRGLDDNFAKATYVPTRLDTELLPRVLRGELDVVLLSGNPGDGKTSVLVQLGDAIKAEGGVVEHEDLAGWRMRLEGRQFIAVFDASESHGDLSSDDLVRQALDPVINNAPTTALIAVNDGRLLQFFTDNEGDYEDWAFAVDDQRRGEDAGDSRIVLVDLKRRSLASLDGAPGLASQVLDVLTADDIWEDCNSCRAQARCPIYANRCLLAGPGRQAFGELILTSHLRRRRRATFRDVRSAAAWLLTGDHGCEDIHDWESRGRSTRYLENSTVSELAFAENSNDYLVDEWTDLDPATVASPRLDSRRRLLGTRSVSEGMTASEAARSLYFGALDLGDAEVRPSDVRAYRYLDEFTSMLTSQGGGTALDRVLLGMSRLVGAFGYTESGLAMSGGMPGSPWAILHTVPAEQFTLELPKLSDAYIEAMPDQLTLRHRAGPRLTLTLDTAEVILRAADGEIVNDVSSDATRQEIDSFVSQLSRQPSTTARIVDSSGSVALASIDGTDIVLEDA